MKEAKVVKERGMRLSRSSTMFALLAWMVVSLGACANEDSDAVQVDENSLFATAISDATDGGASATQLDELRRASEDGFVSFETVKVAVQRTLQCDLDIGLKASYSETRTAAGLPLAGIQVSTGTGDLSETQLNSIEECEYLHSFWISKVYQLQPSSQQLKDELMESRRVEIIQCFRQKGSRISDDASLDEIRQESIALRTQYPDAPGCLAVLGVE